jgi:hypothetical protein
MKAASEKFVKVSNELRDYVVKEGLASEGIENIDERTFKLLQLSSQLITASNELTLKTASVLTSIDEKLAMLNQKMLEPK